MGAIGLDYVADVVFAKFAVHGLAPSCCGPAGGRGPEVGTILVQRLPTPRDRSSEYKRILPRVYPTLRSAGKPAAFQEQQAFAIRNMQS
jgi:hypothetical protein